MEKTLQELKMIIRELILEVGDLKERVTILERDLSEEIEEADKVLVPAPIPEGLGLEGESYENISRLYNEGYHICHMAYGQIRHGECLFCVAFMEKE